MDRRARRDGRRESSLGRSACQPKLARRSSIAGWLANRSSFGGEWPTFALCATVGILRLHSRAKDGGPDQDRTGDLLNAIQARSQLRYRPTRGRDDPLL